MLYQGIELTPANGEVALSHSVILDVIQGSSSSRNTDWLDILSQFPWSLLKDEFYQGYDNVCRLYSLIKMDYQVCNGGIAQYFGNKYHEPRDPYHEDDVALYGIEEQKKDFKKIVAFAQEIYPERTQENEALVNASEAFQKLWLEENAEDFEFIECEEDEYIIDPETGEEIENPEYFEPYEEPFYQDVIHGYEGFDDQFFKASSYLEELLELRAQYYCKLFARDIDKHALELPEVARKMHEILPATAFDSSIGAMKKSPFLDQIQCAAARTKSLDESLNPPEKGIDFDR